MRPNDFDGTAIHLVPTRWPPREWGEHPAKCFTDHGLPDICRCGKGWT